MLQVHYNSYLLDLPIWSIQAGSKIALIQGPIIDPNTLQIMAFYVKYENKLMILSSRDIREITRDGVAIDHEELLAGLADLPKLQPLAELNWSPLDFAVVTRSGQLLGKVVDFTIASPDLHLYQLAVQPPKKLFRRPSKESFLINRSQIIEYDDQKFIVRDSTDLELVDKIDFSKFHNPFRSTLMDKSPAKELS